MRKSSENRSSIHAETFKVQAGYVYQISTKNSSQTCIKEKFRLYGKMEGGRTDLQLTVNARGKSR